MSFPLRFGPCWLDSLLASGQSSLLFRAHAAGDEGEAGGRPLVVKVPYLYLQRNSSFRQIFHERMQALDGLSHPGLVPVEVSGRTHTLVWAASPWQDGWNGAAALEAIRHGGPRPTPRQALGIGLRLAEALEALHGTVTEAGPLVHGELRPGKVLFLPDGSPRLLVASAVTAAAGERSSASSADRFAWRAPEQLLRQPESVETDIRGLALLIFVLMTGSNPFQRRTTASTCSAILQDQVLFEGDAAIPDHLSALLRVAMSSNPERRPYRSMASFAAALRDELEKEGGAQGWQAWMEGLRANFPFSDEEGRPNPERDALMARLVRDAPRAGEPEPPKAAPPPPAKPPEPAKAPEPPRASEPPRISAVRVTPMSAAPIPEPQEISYDAEPTVLFGGDIRRVPGQPEPSGFTLVPDDVGEEPAPSTVRIEQLARRTLPPMEEEEPRTVERPMEVQAEWTGELTAELTGEATGEWTHETSQELSAERTATEDLPAPERRARRTAKVFGASPEVDSSFVLVTDEPTASAGVVVTTDVSGRRESLPERVQWPPAEGAAEDEDFIPALSEEECLAELAREQALRGDDEEEVDELATPIGEELPVLEPLVAQVPASGGARPATRPEVARPVSTLPTLVNQPSPLQEEAPAPLRPPPVKAPAPALAPAPTPAPPPPRPPEPAPKMPPRPPLPVPAQPRHTGLIAAIAVAALLLIALGLKAGGIIGGKPPAPPEETPIARVEPPSEPRIAEPGPGTGGTTTEPPTETPSTGGQSGEAQSGGTTENPPSTPTETNAATQQSGSAQQGGTSVPAETRAGRGTRAAGTVASGPPGLVSLKAENSSETRQDIRGTMRGAFGRPTTTRVPGGGTNGGDQYQLTFRGVESQMDITRMNITSPLVSSVQIVSAPETMTLLVNVSAGCSVSYDVMPSGNTFRIRVTRPTTP